MRILDLTTLYIDGGEGGVNTYLREKARHLAQLSPGVEHSIVVPGKRRARGRLFASTLYTVASPRLPGNPQHRLLLDFPAIKAVVRSEAPDVVEVDTSYLLAHAARRALGPRPVPVVGFHHAHLPMLYTRPTANRLRRRLARNTEALAWRYAEFCARPCDRMIVTSRDMRSRLVARKFPALELVPLGVNLELFQPRGGRPRPTLAGVDPTRPIVLHVGRLSREKDLDVLWRAHQLLHPQCGSQLVVAGDGPLRHSTERFARRNPGVTYVGLCDYGTPLLQLYQSADVLAVPSRNETFSLIVLEAFACGLPVVAARQGGPVELLLDGNGNGDGDGNGNGNGNLERVSLGELALPGDAEDFARKLRSVLEQDPQGWRCRSHVEKHYSWERTFEKLLAIYVSLINERTPEAARCGEPSRIACS